MTITTTSLAVKYCRDRGWFPWKVEFFNSFCKKRLDWYNVFDLSVLDSEPGLIGVQVTSGSNLQARIKKLQETTITVEGKEESFLELWLSKKLRAEVWVFRKLRKKTGKGTYLAIKRVSVYPDRYEVLDEPEQKS